jgi:UDP-N-acetylmuramoyl-tripeptide--D-alanyl-D-alanine ligase
LKSTGNQNNEIGVPLAIMNLRPQHERAVIEMGMYAQGEISRCVTSLSHHIGVVTMVGPVHLERLGSMDAIVAAKRELVEALPEDGVAILNQDDPGVMGMAASTRAQIFTYGSITKPICGLMKLNRWGWTASALLYIIVART